MSNRKVALILLLRCNTTMQSIAQRLRSSYEFDDQVVASVLKIAQDQDLDYRTFVRKYNVSRPITFKTKRLLPIQVLDLRADTVTSDNEADILHLPMANGLTRNKIFRSVVLHRSLSNRRLIVFANPGIPIAHRYGKSERGSLKRVASGDLEPMVASSIGYLQNQKISVVNQYGYSYGADRALALAITAAKTGITVNKSVIAEPASVKSRTILGLMRDFNKSGKGLKATLKASDSKLLRSSRPRRSEHPLLVAMALARPVNLAVARGLSRGGFEDRLRKAMESQPTMRVHLLWGSNSELADDVLLQKIADVFTKAHPDRVRAMRLPGHNHSMADDVSLHAAIMLQASKDLEELVN